MRMLAPKLGPIGIAIFLRAVRRTRKKLHHLSMLVQYSDDEDDDDTTTTTTTTPIGNSLVQYSAEDDEDDTTTTTSTENASKVTLHAVEPSTKRKDYDDEEDYVNLGLLHGTNKPKPKPVILGETNSDSEGDSDGEEKKKPEAKKARIDTFNVTIPTASKAGRYISKKEREEAVIEAAQKEAEAREIYLKSQTGESTESFMNVPPRINKILHNPNNEWKKSVIPKKLTVSFQGHTAGVNCIRWSRPNGQLLASASMDHTVRIWDVFRTQTCVQVLKSHSEAVKEVQWNKEGRQVITASYDKTVKLHDVETGVAIQNFRHKEFVTALAYHPVQHNIFLSGGARSGIACWDSRSNSVIQTYHGMFGQVQCLEFLHNGRQFASSSDITKRNSTDKGIIVWEFDSSIVLSNQVYVETFTCPVIREHPKKKHFLAQSNGNYIAIFGTDYPYKLNRAKRFEGHHVAGYHIGCSISPGGDVVASGSADGSVYFYDWNGANIIKIIQAHTVVCMDAVYHPLVASMVATCSWDGRVSVFE